MKTNDTGVTKKNEVEQSKKKRSHQKKEEVNGSDQQKEEVSGSYPQDELVNESDQQNNNPSVCQNEQSSESNNFECKSNAEIFQDGKEAVKDDNKEVVIEGYKKNEEDGDQVLEVDDKNEKVEFKDGSKTAAEDNRKVECDGNEKFDGDGEKAPKKDGQNSEFDALESTKEKSLIQESHEESKEYKDESQDEGEIRNDNLEVKPTDIVDVEEAPDKRFDEMKRNVESGSDHMKFEQPMSPSEKRQKLHNAQNKIFEGTKFAANTALSLGETAATIGGLAVDMQGKVAGAQATIAGAAAVAAGTVGTAIIKTAVKASSSSSSKDGKKLKETANIPTDTKEDTVETEPVKVVENKNDEVESEEITIDDIKIVTDDIINSIRSTKEVAIDDKCIEKSFSEQTEKLNIVKEKVEYLASNKEGTSSANMRKSDMRYEAMKFRATMDAIEYAETYMSDVKKSTGAEPVSLKTEFEPRKWMNPFTKKMYDKQAKWFKSDQNNKNQNESLNEVEEEPLENEMVEDAATDKFKKYQNPVRRHLTLPIASKLIEHQNKWSKNDA